MAPKRAREDPPAISEEEEENSSDEEEDQDDGDGSASDKEQPPQDDSLNPSADEKRKPDLWADPERVAETESESEECDSDCAPAKRSAAACPSPPPQKKKKLFERVWSEKDEVTLLKGILEWWEKRGVDATGHTADFLNSIKGELSVAVSLDQVREKISKLRKMFVNHAGKGRRGEDKKFKRAHWQERFDLCKKIWGCEGYKQAKKALALEMVRGSKQAELRRRNKDEHVAHLELFIKKNELVLEQAKMMLAAAAQEEE